LDLTTVPAPANSRRTCESPKRLASEKSLRVLAPPADKVADPVADPAEGDAVGVGATVPASVAAG